MSTTLSSFLRETLAGGPAVAVTTEPVLLPPEVEHGVAVRRLDGADMRSRDDLLNAYGTAWNFPDYYWLSWDSFNDCFADLDGQVPPQRTLTGAVPGGFLTVVRRAEQFLADADPDDLKFFATQQAEYRDQYRTPNAYGADRPRPLEFGLVLRTDPPRLGALRRRWAAAGADLVVLTTTEPEADA